MQMSDYLEQLVINHLLRNQAHTPSSQVFLALFSDATDDAGGGTEAAGGSYARKAVTIGAPSGGAAANSAVVTFPNMPAGTWTHAALYDASSAGNSLVHGPLTSSKTTVAGQQLEVAIGEVDVAFSAGSNATTYLRNLIINRFLRNQAHTPAAAIYSALFTDATDVSGGGTELTGGTYARAAMALVAPTGGVTSNSADVSHTGLPDTTADPVTHGALFDASTAGNMLLQGALDAAVSAGSGDIARWVTGDYTLTVR